MGTDFFLLCTDARILLLLTELASVSLGADAGEGVESVLALPRVQARVDRGTLVGLTVAKVATGMDTSYV